MAYPNMTAGSKIPEKKERAQSTSAFALRELDKIANTASFFGFLPIRTPEITKEDISKASIFRNGDIKRKQDEDYIIPQPEEKVALLRTYLEHNMASLPHPLMLYYKKPLSRQGEKKKSNAFQCGLDIIGTTNSVAEALIIKTIYAILTEQGFDSMYIEINTSGDKDSIARFDREMASYVRKNFGEIPSDLRNAFKKDPLELLRTTDERCAELRERAPKPMGYLSEASIQHFKEVLEYLETLNIPYKINENLIGDKTYCSQTIFEIRGNGKGKDQENILLASGCRHNYFSKKIGFKKDIPIMSATICFKKVPENLYKITIKKIVRPKFYFIQLGFRARLKSLIIIDTLRKAKIPVYHSLTKDKFVNQLSTAENLKLSHLIIMGQKEALEDTVVIRHMETRAQDTVSLCDLSQYLQKLK
ncbi:MAG: His/Gly/Thr/Pro-type tRNA ligase C-terminal domain-containing protein [Candidatus Paceibacterota bacterium]